MVTECEICHKHLEPYLISLSRHWHDECQVCTECQQPITIDMVERALLGKATLEHLPCRDKRLERELLTKEVVVTQAHLDFLNKIRLMSWADKEQDIAGNSQTTEQQFRALKIHEMDLDTLYKFLSKYQTVAALVSIVIAQKKDSQLKKASSDYREKTAYEKQIERDKTRSEEAKKLQLQKEREDPALRTRRKAIEGLKKTFPGFTDQQIEDMLGGAK